jgi:protein-tyrosine phosphatase
VDDGSENLGQSAAVLAKFAEQGVTAVCCTPHLKASEVDRVSEPELERLLSQLKGVCPPTIRLTRGFEIMLDVPAAAMRRGLALAGTRYVLVEFGRLITAEASVAALGRIAAGGFVPVLAHPERYAVCSVALARHWLQAGAALQVDATTLLADSRRALRARALVEAGAAAIIASDNHGDGRSLLAAVEWLDGHGGSVQAQRLAVDNPAAILEDADLAPVPPMRIRRSWYSMLKSFVVGGKEA